MKASKSKTRDPVVIIGAGASGLACASALLSSGFNALVLEASGKAGGRIRTLEGFANFPVELGAEEVHGLENSLSPLASAIGAPLIRHRLGDDYVRHLGRLVRMTTASKLAALREVMDFVSSASSHSGSRLSVAQAASLAGLSRQFWHYLESRMGVEHGTTLDRLGISGFAGYDRSWVRREGNYTLAVPYTTLLRPMLDIVGERLGLWSRVTRVEWSAKSTSAVLSDGTRIQASAVVYTGSVAVLRESPPEFAPPLPRRKLSALAKIGMDGGMKVVMKFRHRFWPATMYFLHSDLFLPQFWAAGARRPGSDPVLTAFLGSARADVVRGMGYSPVEFALRELDRIFGRSAASRNFVSAHVEDWSADPFVRGLYSFYPPGSSTADRVELSAPLSGRLFFAGEATDTSGNSATVHGAIDSGRRAAFQVMGRSHAAPGIFR